jgi:hypothetical protein
MVAPVWAVKLRREFMETGKRSAIRLPVRIHCENDALVIDARSYEVAQCRDSEAAKAIVDALNNPSNFNNNETINNK